MLPLEAVCAPKAGPPVIGFLSISIDSCMVSLYKMKLDKMVNFVVEILPQKKGKILLSICLVPVTTEPLWSIPKCYYVGANIIAVLDHEF